MLGRLGALVVVGFGVWLAGCGPTEAQPVCPETKDCGERQCGPDPVCGLSCGECEWTHFCLGGACRCEGTPCGSTCCSGTQVCYEDFACCDAADLCAGSCCLPFFGVACLPVELGGPFCARRCTTSSECGTTDACCTPLADGGVCVAGASVPCMCRTAADCPSGAYVCKADDGSAYGGCEEAGTVCPTDTCCVTDLDGNRFCARECATLAECGGAHCNTYNFGQSACLGPTACGP
jgi:hypothetical protein